MSQRYLRTLSENIAGVVTVTIGLAALAALFWYKHEVIFQMASGGGNPQAQSIPATVVDGNTLQAQLQALEQKKQAKEQARLDAIAKAEADKKAAEEEAKRQAEAAKQAEIEAQQAKEQAEKDRIAAEEAAQQVAAERAAREQETAEKEKAQQQAKAKRKAEEAAKAKAEAEAKRKAEEAAKAKAEAEAKRKAEEAAKAKAEAEEAALEAKLGELGQPSLGDTISSLNAGVAQAQQQATMDFGAAFGNKMAMHWKLPANIPDGLTAELMVRFSRDGELTEVKIHRSSGYPLYDNAAIEAAYAAAPVPLPNNPDAIELLVKEGVIVIFAP